jgi:hypothetical protein
MLQPDDGIMQFVCEPDAVKLEAAAVVSDDGKPRLPRFSMVAYTGGKMLIEGQSYPVVVDFSGLAIPSQRMPTRLQHNPENGVGHTDRIEIVNGELLVAGVISRGTAAASEVVASSLNGFPWRASIGSTIEQFTFVRAGQTTSVNGRQFDGPLKVVTKATLGEISFVDIGADVNTSVSVAASAKRSDIMPKTEQHDEPKAEVLGDENSGDKVEKIEAAAKTGDATTDSGKLQAQSVLELRAAHAAEIKRIAAIEKVCGGKHLEIQAKAIEGDWTVEKCELEILRAARPTPPAVHVPESGTDGSILEAAAWLSAKLPDAEKRFDEKTLEAADKQFKGTMGLQKLLLEAAWLNGYTGRHCPGQRELLGWAFSSDVRAGWSTADISGILSNVANKSLMQGFMAVDQTWRRISDVNPVNDLKAITRYRLTGDTQYEQLAPTGEIKHGTMAEDSFSNRAYTYAKMLTIKREDIINDDLGAITTNPRRLGRGSALKINDVFWTTFLNNSTLFATTNTNANKATGAGTALSITSLTAAELLFMSQIDSDGKPLGSQPAILLVPTALKSLATQLYVSTEMRDTTATTKYLTSNPFAGRFRVESSPYMHNSKYTGYSSTAWYLLADPNDIPVIETVFLNGQEAPTIEQADADFNVLGIQMRGYHDFGCAQMDFRGGVMMAGA